MCIEIYGSEKVHWMRTRAKRRPKKKSKLEEQSVWNLLESGRQHVKVWMRAKRETRIKINLRTVLRSFAYEFIRESYLSCVRLKCHIATAIWLLRAHCQSVHRATHIMLVYSMLILLIAQWTLAYYFVLIWCLQCWHNVHINLCITASISG